MADQDRDPQFQTEASSGSQKLEFLGEPGAQAELFQAIAKASGEFARVMNEAPGQVGHRNFFYADLDTLVQATRPALTKHGIAVMQFMIGPDDVGNHRVTTVVAGAGAQIRAHIDYKRAGDLKTWGMQTTYIRRYAYRALFQLDGSDDADTGAQEVHQGPRQNAQPKPPSAPQKAKPEAEKRQEAAPAKEPEKRHASAPPAAPPKETAKPAPEKEPENPKPEATKPEPEKPVNGTPAAADAPPTPEQFSELKDIFKSRQCVYRNARGELLSYPKFTDALITEFVVAVCGVPPQQIQTAAQVAKVLEAGRVMPARQAETPGAS